MIIPFQRRDGFTLVELSIVLVIIGLIVGGVLVGRDLIDTAANRKIVTQYEKYISSVQAFRNKYGCLPGDCTNATQYFGAAGDGCTIDLTASRTATCNGNGDRIIGSLSATGPNYGTSVEQFLFWQHLGNAGLIDGQYSGSPLSNGANAFWSGVNTPASDYTSRNNRSSCCLSAGTLVWAVFSFGNPSGSYASRYLPGPYVNAISLASQETNPSYFYWIGMRPADAYYIDEKLDDGKGFSGKIISSELTSVGTCYDHTTGAYAVSVTSGPCGPIYNNAF